MSWRARARGPLSLSLAIGVCLLLAGCGGDPQVDQGNADNPGGVIVSDGAGGGPYAGAEPAKPYTMPDVTLTDTNGNDFNLRRDTGSPVTLFFFGYTHCPDVCPLVMNDVTAAILQLPDDVQAEIQMVFVTTDPARDTPDVLREYLDHYDPDFVGLTGDLGDVIKASDAMGVAIEGKHQLPSGGYDVGHGAQVIGFHGDQAPVIWTQGTPVDDMVSDIEKLAQS